MYHDFSKKTMTALAVTLLILSVLSVGLRLWAKILLKRVGWDDFLTLGALTVSMTCCALQLATAEYGHLGSHELLDAAGQPIMDDPGLLFFQRTKFAINMISIVGLGLTKSSLLVLYKSIFDVPRFRVAVYCVLAYVVGWTISFTLSHLLTCYPITVFIDPFYGKHCVKIVPMFLALLYTDVFADIIILLLPIPMVLGIRLGASKKAGVIGMFTLGSAVCAVSITRVVATHAIAGEYLQHPNDVIYYTGPIFFWTNIELSLGVVCACLPSLRPIWLFFYPRPTGTGFEYGPTDPNESDHSRRFLTKPSQQDDEIDLAYRATCTVLPPENALVASQHGITKTVTIHQVIA